MSLILSSSSGFFISHEDFINEIYKNASTTYRFNPNLFKIENPYKIHKKRKKQRLRKPLIEDTEVLRVENLYDRFCKENPDFLKNEETSTSEINTEAITAANHAYSQSGLNPIISLIGSNNGPPLTKNINNSTYIFPENCNFFCKDVTDIGAHFKDCSKFDFIILDPPWWNKYIRRKRKVSDDAYDMMYNKNLKEIPMGNLLKTTGLVVVWCTNSAAHLNDLINDIFPSWGLKYITKWYWLKVTKSGVPICPFGPAGNKQPFEQIIFATAQASTVEIPQNKLVVSVPSAIHSHKPPLIELLKPFIGENASCLEVFARYLMPNCTSYGLEVLRLQHESLYVKL